MGDDFSGWTRQKIETRAGNACSNPDCRVYTSGPHTDPNKAVRMGEAAHILAASENGPRYDPAISSAERRSVSNGIWLCIPCAKIIDKDEARYPVDLLRRWKAAAEARAQRECGVRARPIETAPDPEGVLTCPFCGTESRVGLLVCRGCHADIIYRATQAEFKDAMAGGALLVVAPTVTLQAVALVFGVGLSLDPKTWLIVGSMIAAIAYTVALVSAVRVKKRLANRPRFFRRVPL